MLSMLKNWKGQVEVNGVIYNRIAEIVPSTLATGSVSIKLHSAVQTAVKNDGNPVTTTDNKEVRITVKQYMTKKATDDFDFMSKWNNDDPMPYRTMTGVKVKETRGMVYMKLHGDIWADRITHCMCCGKKLTNPVSQYFGIGPECGGHNYVNPFEDEEQLKEAVEAVRKKLVNVTWEGWIIKSAITEEVQV